MKLNVGLIFAAFTILAQPAFSTTQSLEDLQYQTDVSAIKKLEETLDKVPSSSKVLIEIRLGDLYAEQARRTFQDEVQSGKKNHAASIKQRQAALRYYQGTQERLKNDDRLFDVQIKIATIQSEVGDSKSALNTLNQLISNKKTPSSIKSTALKHRAHAYFSAGDYKKSEADYKQLNHANLDLSESSLIYYRLAWSQVQLQKIKEAKFNYNKAIHQVVKSNHQEGLDIFLDYAALMTQDKQSTASEIVTLINKAHPNLQNRLTTEIAEEAFRLARYDIAIPLYTQISQQSSFDDYLIILAKLRLVLIDNGKQDKAFIESFKSVLRDSTNCKHSGDKCQLLKKELRSFVLQTHKVKKARPDASVLNIYKAYLDFYNDESALFITAANVASYLDLHHDARVLFEKGILIEKDTKVKEDFLLANLSRAESGKDQTDKKLSYLFYLLHGQNSNLKAQIELEIAQLDFAEKKWDLAFERAHRITESQAIKMSLKTQASEIAIRSLINKEDHPLVQKIANQYSKLFKDKKIYFSDIARKAEVTQVLAATQDPKKLSDPELRSKFNQLKMLSFQESNLEERKLLIKNLNRIANDSLILDLRIDSLMVFLTLKNIQASERLEATAALYQIYLDQGRFKKAFDLVKTNKSLLKVTDLEIAQLADIEGLKSSAIQFYTLALSSSKLSSSEKSSIATRIIANSHNKKAALKKYFSTLKLNTKNLDLTLSNLYISEPSLRVTIEDSTEKIKTPLVNLASQRVKGYYFLQGLNLKPSKNIKLDHSPASLKRYQSFLDQLDQSLQKAQQIDSVGSQLVTLRAIHLYNTMFVEDLAKLPIPKEVTKSNEASYLNQIKALSVPYLEKAALAKRQADRLESTLLVNLEFERSQARIELTHFLDSEAYLIEKKLSGFTTKFKAQDLVRFSKARLDLWKSKQKESSHQIDKNFYTLETQFGNPVYAEFLSTRNNSRKSGARL